MKKIILTGGGTAGHVTPNIALIPTLIKQGFDIHYIGSYTGIEKQLIEKENISYTGISSGKLRRYFDIKNFSDPFRVMKGYFEARKILKTYRPDVVFSKGGFVTVPVVIAASHLGIPVIIHESDITPGLANKIAFHCANKICASFPETLALLPREKSILTGSPIRSELLMGDATRAKRSLGFTDDKPILLMIGGSLGSVVINKILRASLDRLLPRFHILHICGKGNIDKNLSEKDGYVQFEYVDTQLADFFALADVILSRAGANTLSEILALKKPSLLIPLSASASRGDQILNANSYQKSGYAHVLTEEELSIETLIDAIDYTYQNRHLLVQAMKKKQGQSGVKAVMKVIEGVYK